jgi:uncharacterized sporulation protein YeaH/YhbH (DUF444 family)
VAIHIVDRRLNPGSKSLENRQRFLRRAKALVQGAVKKSSQDGTSRMSWKAARSASRSMAWTSRAFAAKAARATWCFPETRSSSKATCCRVRARDRRQGRGQGEGDSEDAFRFVLSRDEFVDLFLDDLELPDLAKRKLAEVESEGFAGPAMRPPARPRTFR